MRTLEGQKEIAMCANPLLPNPKLNRLTEEFDGIDPRDMPAFCPACGACMELPDCVTCGHLVEMRA